MSVTASSLLEDPTVPNVTLINHQPWKSILQWIESNEIVSVHSFTHKVKTSAVQVHKISIIWLDQSHQTQLPRLNVKQTLSVDGFFFLLFLCQPINVSVVLYYGICFLWSDMNCCFISYPAKTPWVMSDLPFSPCRVLDFCSVGALSSSTSF